MSGIKKLAGQTLWYGVPTIAGRFIGYLLSVFLFRWYGPSVTADITQVYALIPFLNILFTYGLETAYFRFSDKDNETGLFNTLQTSLLISTFLFCLVLLMLSGTLSQWTSLQDKPEYFRWMVYVLFFDTLAALPFARLRQQERPRKYALIKVVNVLLMVALSVFFLRICPYLQAKNPKNGLLFFYRPELGIGYYIIANALASALTLLLLRREWLGYRFRLDGTQWKQVMRYAYPLLIVGFGGMINEMLSRLVYSHVLQLPLSEEKRQLGIFGASYKIAVLITLFIQVFKMAAEPFFFKQRHSAGAQVTYARVMKFFVMACALMWLAIGLLLPLITRLAYGSNYVAYREGSGIIPILAMGSVLLGMYYNLSIWYKLTQHTWTGAWITIGGAVITIVCNIWWIPRYGYTGSAWATFVCYAAMTVVSYLLGQRYYPIPYPTFRCLTYLAVATAFYLVYQYWITNWQPDSLIQVSSAAMVLAFYALLLLRWEKKEFAALPVIGRYIARW